MMYEVVLTLKVPYINEAGQLVEGSYDFKENGPLFDSEAEAEAFAARAHAAMGDCSTASLMVWPVEHEPRQWTKVEDEDPTEEEDGS